MKRPAMESMELSLKDAAQLVGVSKVTLWRAVQRGELSAAQDEKNRYTVNRETVLLWKETYHPQAPETATREVFCPETFLETPVTPRNASAPFTETVRNGCEAVFETVEMVSADLHRVALETARHALEAARKAEERAERAERHREALTGQIAQYQQVLTDRAESLLQSEAQAKQAQMLAEENAERLAQFQREQEELQEQLKRTRARVEWFEKRVPRWVRRCFGAG